MNFILNRLKAIILIVFGAIRRALCCFRMRRRSYSNNIEDCLTDVGVIPNRNDSEVNTWDNKWGEEPINRPQTIQDHIQMYREKIAQPTAPENTREDEELNSIFQELTPQYIKQKKVVIGSGTRSRTADTDLSRLSVSESGINSDLGEWVEGSGSGWDEQYVDPLDVIREQRRIKRENRQQSTVLGKKLKT